METHTQTQDETQARQVGCCDCDLHRTRTNIVWGSGDPLSSLWFIGEAPGELEDRRGYPFVGRSGEQLTRWLRYILYRARMDVYITNVLKCRPPGNATPIPAWIVPCSKWLIAEITHWNPRVLVLLGNTALTWVLEHSTCEWRGDVSQCVGQLWELSVCGKSLLVYPLYHPTTCLRSSERDNEQTAALRALYSVLADPEIGVDDIPF